MRVRSVDPPDPNLGAEIDSIAEIVVSVTESSLGHPTFLIIKASIVFQSTYGHIYVNGLCSTLTVINVQSSGPFA